MQENVITYTVENSPARQFIIGDIHGCAKTFKALLKQLSLTKEDQLFILGDLINRGENSKKVIKKILKLRKQSYNIHVLRGNHEQQFLDYVTLMPVSFYQRYLKRAKMKDFMNKDGEIKKKYFKFFKSLPHYLEIDTAFLVHAGFNSENTFSDAASMMTIRKIDTEKLKLNGKRLIHAHTPVSLTKIQEMCTEKKMRINLDNGCILGKKAKDMGNLVCLELKSFTLFVQKNIE